MAEYIRFRWTRAKAGVTMAFLALLGGLADRAANAEAAHDAARTAAAADFFPKLTFNGLSGSVKSQFVKLDKDLQTSFAKYDKAIATLSKHVVELKSNVYDKLEANATFLSRQDAGKIYMKDGSEAANSAELGGLAPSEVVHGTGGIATGTGTVVPGATAALLSSQDRSLTVTAAPSASTGPAFTITNNTTGAMRWIATVNGQTTDGTLPAGTTSQPIVINDGSDTGQATVQLLPAVQNQAFTLTVSALPGSGGGTEFVGQMVNGDG